MPSRRAAVVPRGGTERAGRRPTVSARCHLGRPEPRRRQPRGPPTLQGRLSRAGPRPSRVCHPNRAWRRAVGRRSAAERPPARSCRPGCRPSRGWSAIGPPPPLRLLRAAAEAGAGRARPVTRPARAAEPQSRRRLTETRVTPRRRTARPNGNRSSSPLCELTSLSGGGGGGVRDLCSRAMDAVGRLEHAVVERAGLLWREQGCCGAGEGNRAFFMRLFCKQAARPCNVRYYVKLAM